MSDDVLKEIKALRETLKFVQDRIDQLERRVTHLMPAAPPTPKPTPAVFKPVPAVIRPSSPPPSQITIPSKPDQTETLETRIGRDWLNRIGITSLVLGVAFFILYTFQYLGPAMKIATGFAIAGGLIGLGVWLERRASLRWYALGLIGGGWALLYFTTYAMHHLPRVRVLDSAWIDWLLLMGVAAGAVWHSLKYRSETITALALLLGFITTSISNVTYFTLASSALLVGALAWIVVRMRWHRLYLYGVIASYATYLFWIDPQIRLSLMVAIRVANVAEAEFWLKAGFVSLYWVAYNAVLLALDEKELRQRNALLSATLINTLLFVQTALSGMDPLYRQARYLFLLVVGAAYVLSEPLAKRRALPTIATTHLLLGLSLMTLAIPLKLSGRWVSFLWTAEVAFFVWMGLRYARWSYRLFALGLAVIIFGRLLFLDLWNSQAIAILSWSVPWRALIGCVGIGSFGLAAAWYRLPQHQQALRSMESQAFHLYLFASAILMWFLIMVEANVRWLSAAWAVEATGTVLLGFWLRDRAVRLIGTVGCGVVALWVVGLMVWVAGGYPAEWNPWAASGVIALFYGLSWLYRSLPTGDSFKLEKWFQDLYAVGATILLTGLLWLEISRQWLSVAWAVEGLALVAAGFILRDKVFRVSGLSVFGLLVLKILFVDLAGAETIYRILSFIVAGVILLLASFAYARFTGKLVPPKRS